MNRELLTMKDNAAHHRKYEPLTQDDPEDQV
jgi:hypothetical protein